MKHVNYDFLNERGLFRQLLLTVCLLIFCSASAFAQKSVKGNVSDVKGEPIIGASIVLKDNTSVGTITDFDGNFSLDIPSLNSTLVISYIGYKTQEVSAKSSLKIILEEDNEVLDEVVVIGYGVQRKGDVTSSVASVKADNFVKGAVKDVGQLIQGKVAGLAITNPSGDPTGTTQIRLRGTNTIGGANTTPLVLIDGVPGDLSTVAPEDVESVDVLKDGSAAAIYGTRGTNGVILITTKQAKGGDINQVEYSGYISTSQIAKKLDMLNADEFAALYPDYDYGYDTDWIDEISRTPVTHVHNLSLMGGNSKTNYIANLNYSARQGIMKKSDFDNFQGRIEITHRMFDDKLKIKFGLFGKKNQMESTTNGGSFRGWIYGQATRRNPTEPVRNEDGSWFENVSKFEYENPMALLYEADGNVKRVELRYNGNITYNPIKDLTINALFSYNRINMNRGYSETLNHISALRDGLDGWSSVGASTNMEKVMEITAQYNKTIKDHKFSILGGYSYNETDYEDMYFDNYGFQNDIFGGHFLAVQRNGYALFEIQRNVGGFVRRLHGRHAHFEETGFVVHGFVARVFEVETFVREVPEVLVFGIVGLAVDFKRNFVRFGIIDFFFTGLDVPFPPRRDDGHIGRKGFDCEFETHLVVALARATVTDCVCVFFLCDFDNSLRDYGTRKRRAEHISFVQRTRLDGGNDVVVHEFVGEVFDIQFGSTGFECFFFETFEFVSLSDVAGDGDDFAVVVVFFEPRNND